MELDKTAIVIRQRSVPDLIDLSLVVVRSYWKPLLTYAAVGVVPFWLFNTIILRPFCDYDSILMYDSFAIDEGPYRVRYVMFLMGFVFLQTPIAMLGVTYFLGHTLFLQPTSFRELRSIAVKMLLGLVLVLGLFRFGVMAWLVVLLMPTQTEFDPLLEIFWLGVVLCGTAILVRAFRPFAPEILMLEQAPMRSRTKTDDGQSLAFRKRSYGLHSQLSGDLIVRAIAMLIAMLMMLVAVTLGELFISGVFFGVWTWEWWMDIVIFPINLWLVAIWGTVFRFLSYLDCRTRLEGWELDLRLRAESRRLMEANHVF